MERYIPVSPARPKPPHVWLLFLQVGYKRAVLGTTILSNGKGCFDPTDRNERTTFKWKVVPNIQIGLNRNGPRVLSRIHRLGEKSRVATSFLAESGGIPPPEIFWNGYALRSNLVHFETQFWEMLQRYFILFLRHDHVPCHIVSLDRKYLIHVH